MAARRTLTLSEAERHELEAVAAHAAKPYQRERAAALLKIANGQSPHAVARHGLLIERDPDTVYAWLDRYEAERQAKQQVGKGRGRKPAFSPSASG
jgi:transposase